MVRTISPRQVNNAGSIDFTTSNGTAEDGSDYSATSGTLMIPPGAASGNIVVNITNNMDDSLDENAESFNVAIINPVYALLTNDSGLVTITDNDSPPTMSITDVTVDEFAGTANFDVSLSAASGKPVTIDYQTSNGTAIAGADYIAISLTTLTFQPGQTVKNVNVTITPDMLDESFDETFFVDLFNESNATLPIGTQGQGTIWDDDEPPQISVNDASAAETGVMMTTQHFFVTLSVPSALTVTVNYSTNDVTATSPADYVAASGTLVFPPGTVSQEVVIDMLFDTIFEDNETFTFDLQFENNASILDNQGIGTMLNSGPLPQLSIGDASADESAGTIDFVVSLDQVSPLSTGFGFVVTDVTATDGIDYWTVLGPLTISAGSMSETLSFSLFDDFVFEGDETFTVDLIDPVNAFHNRGVAYTAVGEFLSAVEDFDQAILVQPEDAQSFASRAFANTAQGDYDRALQDYDQAIGFDSESTVTYFHRADLHRARGEYRRAIQDHSRAIVLDPNFNLACSDRDECQAVLADESEG